MAPQCSGHSFAAVLSRIFADGTDVLTALVQPLDTGSNTTTVVRFYEITHHQRNYTLSHAWMYIVLVLGF